MSTHQTGRRIRRIGLLLVGAFVAIMIAGIGTSTAQGLTRGGVALGGFTSQGWPVVLELGGAGKLVTQTAVGLDMTCTSGDKFSVEDGWQVLDIAKNGKLQTTEQLPPVQTQGTTLTGSHSLTGRFDRHRSTFRGVWRLQLNYTAADGTTDQCQSGPVKLLATL